MNRGYLGLILVFTLASCSKPETISNLESINCQQIERSEFENILQDETKLGILAALSGAPVKMRFNIDTAEMKDVVLIVYSSRAGEVPIYRGPLTDVIQLFPKPELYDQGGLDNLDFKLFDLNKTKICRQQQDGGTQYWERGKNILIEFLAEREIDPNFGTPLGHKVHLE